MVLPCSHDSPKAVDRAVLIARLADVSGGGGDFQVNMSLCEYGSWRTREGSEQL